MSATRVRVGMFLAMTACLMTGCSNGGNDDSAPPSPTLMGRTFVSTAVEGQQIPGGGPMTLTFADGKISANSGCNTASGTVDLADNTLKVGALATTLMGCPDDRGQADTWQDALLTSAPTWRLDGDTLTVTGKDVTVKLLDKKVAHPDKPLTGTTWFITTLLTPDAQIRSQTIDEVKPTLTIASDGTVTGSAGCNRLMGKATVEPAAAGADVTFQVGTTKMLCTPEIMEVEQAVLKTLDGKAAAVVDANTLTLRNTNGNGLMLNAE